MEVQARLRGFRERHAWLWGLIQSASFSSEPAEVPVEPGTSLRRLQSFLDSVGNPERGFPAIHIAGTSGKGSVTMLLSRILSAAGYRTGNHISPYLQLPHEKLVVDERWISVAGFNRLLDAFAADYARWQGSQDQYDRLRYGEAWVALTFLFLMRERVDWGIVECGMGGRWDATNAVRPVLSLITNVGPDHLVSLGGSLESVADHKAGILKTGSLGLTGETQPALLARLRREAAVRKVRLHTVGPMAAAGEDWTFRYAVERTRSGGLELTLHSPMARHDRLPLRDQALFQGANAALAVAAVDLLQAEGRVEVPEEAMIAALSQGGVPGRMETMQTSPRVLLDCAHNVPKAQALVRALRDAFPERTFLSIAGMLRTKDASGILAALSELPGDFLLCQPHVFAKSSHPPGDLARAFPVAEKHRIKGLFHDVDHALRHALRVAGPDTIILVTGSVYLVGEARDLWHPRERLLEELAQTP